MYGGTGSLNDAYHTISLIESLETAGFKINADLVKFYTDYRADRPSPAMWNQEWTIVEPPAANYSNDLVCSNSDHVVLVYNGAAAMELGFVAEHPQIKSVLWCPALGQISFNALGEILNGTVNPSGRSADTFVYDLTSSPAWNNSVPHKYDNMDKFNVPGLLTDTPSTPSFINYVEGIYVGYPSGRKPQKGFLPMLLGVPVISIGIPAVISVKDLVPEMEASNQEFLTVSNIQAVVRRASLMIACAIMRVAYPELDHSTSMMIADYSLP